MPKRKFVFYILYLFCCFTSCINILFYDNKGLWFYTYSSGEIPSTFTLTPASFLYLNPDKTYTLDFGEFKYGKWMKRGDTLVLHSVSGEITSYLVNYENNKNLKLTIAPGWFRILQEQLLLFLLMLKILFHYKITGGVFPQDIKKHHQN